MVAIHSSILDKIQSDKTENSDPWSSKEEFERVPSQTMGSGEKFWFSIVMNHPKKWFI